MELIVPICQFNRYEQNTAYLQKLPVLFKDRRKQKKRKKDHFYLFVEIKGNMHVGGVKSYRLIREKLRTKEHSEPVITQDYLPPEQ